MLLLATNIYFDIPIYQNIILNKNIKKLIFFDKGEKVIKITL